MHVLQFALLEEGRDQHGCGCSAQCKNHLSLHVLVQVEFHCHIGYSIVTCAGGRMIVLTKSSKTSIIVDPHISQILYLHFMPSQNATNIQWKLQQYENYTCGINTLA